MTTDKEILEKEKEIKRLKKELKTDILAKKLSSLIKLEDYSDEEKIRTFDGFYKYAKDVLATTIKHKHPPKDHKYYAYEMMMDLMGSGFWDILNEYVE